MYKNQQEARGQGGQALYDLARHCMWERLERPAPIDGTAHNYQPIQEDYTAAMKNFSLNSLLTVECMDTPPETWNCIKPCISDSQKENNMYAKTEISTEKSSLNYITSRLTDIFYAKRADVATFYKVEGIHPSTPAQAKEWLKTGNYRIETPYKDEVYESGNKNFYFPGSFQWGKEGYDQKAYGKALTVLETAYQTAKDIVNIKTDEHERLKALQDFESYTIH